MQTVVIPRMQVPPFTLLKIAMPMVIIAFLMMALSETQIALTSAMVIQGFGMGLAGPSFMAGASLAVSPEETGRRCWHRQLLPATGVYHWPIDWNLSVFNGTDLTLLVRIVGLYRFIYFYPKGKNRAQKIASFADCAYQGTLDR